MMSCENDEERGFDFQFDELLFLFQHLQQITSQSPEDMPRFMPSPQSHAESRICSTCNATSDRTISGMPRPTMTPSTARLSSSSSMVMNTRTRKKQRPLTTLHHPKVSQGVPQVSHTSACMNNARVV